MKTSKRGREEKEQMNEKQRQSRKKEVGKGGQG